MKTFKNHRHTFMSLTLTVFGIIFSFCQGPSSSTFDNVVMGDNINNNYLAIDYLLSNINEDGLSLSSSAQLDVNTLNCPSARSSSRKLPERAIRIPKTSFAIILNSNLRSMRVKLHNFGSRHRDSAGDISWFDGNESYLLLEDRKYNINIPEYTRGVRDKKYYMNDMNLSSTITSFNGDQLHMLLTFEENGTELKGLCSNCAKFREDRAAPDYQLNNNRWDVILKLIVFGGRVSLEVEEVKYLGQVDGKVFGELFDGLVHRILIPQMELAFRNGFNAQREAIASQITASAERAGFDLARVTGITFEGQYIVIHMS